LIYVISARKELATVGAWCFNFSPVFYYYTVNPMPDNMALCCGIWSLAWFCGYVRTGRWLSIVLTGVFLCLATMCKLPFILYGSFVATYLIAAALKRHLTIGKFLAIAAVLVLCILPALLWYAWVVPGWVIGATRGITDQSLNHPVLSKVIIGTIVSVLPELLINYASVIFFIAGFYAAYKRKLYDRSLFLPFAVLGVITIFYFLFEMNIIDLVHDYYLFPFLPLIFLLVAYGVEHLLSAHSYKKYVAFACLAILPLTAFLRINSRWDVNSPGFNVAYLKYKDELRSLTPKDAKVVVGYDESHYILLY
jgi:hypothetical protein